MIKKILNRVLIKRHFWRYATLNDLLELYTSNMLRAVASNIFSIFIPVYLLKTGYSVFSICLYFIAYFSSRILMDCITGFTVARIGPKHSWIISHFSNILNLGCLLLLPNHPELFWVGAIFNAAGTSFQLIPLHVNFSKIKHIEHSGKEQSVFTVLEKIGLSAGPLLGGYVAATYGASYSIILAILIYTGSIIPLMLSPEPVRTKQKIHFRGFPLNTVWRDICSNAFRAVDATVTTNVWPIYMTLVIFTESSYEKIGLITTLSILIAIGSAFWLGKLIDNKNSLVFFRISVVFDSLIHIARAFTSNFVGALAVNTVNEVAVNGVTIGWTKGAYDAVEDLPGYRIIYFVVLEMTGHIFKIIIWSSLAILTMYNSDIRSLQIIFIVTALLVPLIMLEKFKALRPGFFARLIQ